MFKPCQSTEAVLVWALKTLHERTNCTCKSHLFKQCVVGAVQVELSQIVAVGKDQEGLLVCRELDDVLGEVGFIILGVTELVAFLTRGRFAYGGVFGAETETLHTQTVEAAVRVDAPLRAGIGGCALVYVDTSLPIVLQTETRMASALLGGKPQSK